MRAGGARAFTLETVQTLVLGLMAATALSTGAMAQAPPVTASDFAAAVAESDAYEIAAAQIVLTESHNPSVRDFAQQMVRAHLSMNAALVQAAARSGLKPPAAIVGGELAPLLAALQGARGPDLDLAYARQQVVAHSGALTSEGRYARAGSDEGLRRVAASDLPLINQHLQAARALRSTLAVASSLNVSCR